MSDKEREGMESATQKGKLLSPYMEIPVYIHSIAH